MHENNNLHPSLPPSLPLQPPQPLVTNVAKMHENKYLHLPVVDESSGTVLGVVSVMEIIQATAGDRGSSRYAMFFMKSTVLWLFILVVFNCSSTALTYRRFCRCH